MSAKSNIRLIAPVSYTALDNLRGTLSRCWTTFNTYRRLFDSAGVSRKLIEDDPIAALQMLPLLEGDALNELIVESLSIGEQIIDMETSSGTTGPRKRRLISHTDDASETEFLAELFVVCGIGSADRVACLDTDPLTLMISFTKALDVLGVEEAYAYCVGADFDQTLAVLPALEPSVIICVPSILERCFDTLTRHFDARASRRLTKVVYVGEGMSNHLRARLESELGVEVFGYYGASETSALGIECRAHDGIHLFTDRNVIEILPDSPDGLTGEIVVTTLCQNTLPLIRYRLNDVIAVNENECPCGLSSPRVDVLGRKGEGFSILGAKFYYEPILEACYNGRDDERLMNIVLSREERDRLTVVLPNALSNSEKSIKDAIFRSQPDLDFLSGSKYLDIGFVFEDQVYFRDNRKQKKIVDLR